MLFPEMRSDTDSVGGRAGRSGSFVNNMKLPIHRWFRYSAGFSAEWASQVVENSSVSNSVILDPFAGSGTTMVVSKILGKKSYGIEPHPFVAKIARAKLEFEREPDELAKIANDFVASASKNWSPRISDDALLNRCYSPEAFGQLESLRESYFVKTEIPDHYRRLVWLAITSIIRECSHVGTAQWQYILPNKSKARVSIPFEAFSRKIGTMVDDMRKIQVINRGASCTIFQNDAREQIDDIPKGCVDLVITSPPYPNNFDYADATRLEMTFWGDVSSWGDLHDKVRKHLMRSCSQHTAKDKLDLETLLATPTIRPILNELSDVCEQLERIRHEKGGKKSYHTMVAAYFIDLSLIWSQLRRVCRDGSTVCFVVGDSAPYGIYVPAERWLGELALASGFKDWKFEKLRCRNTKWKNRKHRVPLHEGNLWISG